MNVAILRKRLATLPSGTPLTMYSGEVVRVVLPHRSKGGGRIVVSGANGVRLISITCLVNLHPDGFLPECVAKMRANGQTSWDGQ